MPGIVAGGGWEIDAAAKAGVGSGAEKGEMMQGRIDTSFQTLQRDLFASGMAARIGMSSFGVWLAIKSHADYNTGECWPGMRRLSDLTGLSLGAVSKCVRTLVDVRLLRVLSAGSGKRGNRYVARERLDVRLGDRVLCTIVVDYVPATLRATLAEIDQALVGKREREVLARCEILPGEGFVWDPKIVALRAEIPAGELPPPDHAEEVLKRPLIERVKVLQQRLKVSG
jgi:hypothetical protein